MKEDQIIDASNNIPTEEDIRKQERAILKERLSTVFNNPEIRKAVEADYSFTFQQIGLSKEEAEKLTSAVIDIIQTSETLEESEQKIRSLFESTMIGKSNLFATLKEKMKNRSDRILTQLRPYLEDITGKVFDYGTGSGMVSQKIHDTLGLEIEGADVRDFRAPQVTIPFKIFDGKQVPGVADKEYEAAIITNVIHHEKDNKVILDELDRIIKRKLVIIETIPEGETPEEVEKDMERTFANDVLWNRYFNYADIPVPGTYETPEGWVKRFEAYGWKLKHEENLGYDEPTIHDVHYLLVFER